MATLKLPVGIELKVKAEEGFLLVEGIPSVNPTKDILKDAFGESFNDPDKLKKAVDDLSGASARELILKIVDKISEP